MNHKTHGAHTRVSQLEDDHDMCLGGYLQGGGPMGVQNLWQLLQPVGRRISVETLERKVGPSLPPSSRTLQA